MAYSPFLRYAVKMNYAAPLRRDLAQRAHHFANANGLTHTLSYGESPTVCFPPAAKQHGNFHPASYKAIVANPAWSRRLSKVHTQYRNIPQSNHGRWMELDTCTSSDALLMNVFCHPHALRDGVPRLLGIEPGSQPRLGIRARVPLLNGHSDRTEVDMRICNLLVEAKLTEGDFQKADKRVLETYRDFRDIFDTETLPQTEKHYLSYQLLRNVLAAENLACSFCVLLDARRPDLLEGWYAVVRCVRPVDLRTRMRVLTWQELATALPETLQKFLAEKYGINP